LIKKNLLLDGRNRQYLWLERGKRKSGKATWEPIRTDILIFNSRTKITVFNLHGNPILVAYIMAKSLNELLKPLIGKGFMRFYL